MCRSSHFSSSSFSLLPFLQPLPSVVMFCRFAALCVVFLLFHVRGQNVDLTHGRDLSSRWELDFPEIDGSAVDGCGIFPETTAPPTISTTTTTKTTPVTRKVVTTTKKPAVRSTPRKPVTRSNGPPIRPQPAPSGPITNRHSNPSLRLLHYLLTNGRRHQAGSLPGFKSRIAQPIGGRSSSESDELPSTLRNRARGAERKVWKMGSSSSADSSD
ncbi:uncharacterized protein LOC132958538 [Labrus mixtus]|uniref:uncharacterized protein LOC132958538 n=1 Tax=Labrus mixtus TaxID=508554 RepID=UPI0029C0FA40|nr:uncharacterized protein LOC132958538 [Labrus mixtus]